MELYKINSGNKLETVQPKQFKLEREIQNLIEGNLKEIFDLQFVTSELTIKNFRIDTLSFDKSNNCFVIIEYKKGKSYSVIDQGYSYLSLMLNNKSDFILEYNENTNNNLKRGDVDWTQSKVIFISPNFSTYQKESINFKDLPIELFEIKQFSNKTLSLNPIKGNSSESVSTVSKASSVIKNVSKEVVVYTEDHIVLFGEKEIQSLYDSIRTRILEYDDVIIKPTKVYIGFLRNRNFCSVNIQKKKIKLWKM